MNQDNEIIRKYFLKEAVLVVAFLSVAAFGQGRIALESCGDNNCEVFIMNADGSGVSRLTFEPGYDGNPSLSANGRKIAFVSTRSTFIQIWVMNPDGSDQRQLTLTIADNIQPSISPDGRRIAFVSARTGSYQIWMMNSDGSNQIQLTSEGNNRSPSFSPDGNRIAFEADRLGTEQIFVMNADGSNQHALTSFAQGALEPSFGPIEDGRIVFSANFPGPEIWVMDPDGTSQIRLTNNTASDLRPSMGPSGRIAFASNRDGDYEIFTMNANGTNQTQVTFNFVPETNPSWGAYLAPTSAAVEVSGRVLTSDGNGVPNATIILTDPFGNTRKAVTSSFGYYRFEAIEVGQSYIAEVRSKRYQFTPQVISVVDTVSDLDFIAANLFDTGTAFGANGDRPSRGH